VCRSFAHAGIERRNGLRGAAQVRRLTAQFTLPGVDAPTRSGARSIAIPRTLLSSGHPVHESHSHTQITDGMSDLCIRFSLRRYRPSGYLRPAASGGRRRRQT
jgi:hypothetical protein